jgi:hypothetical protein
MGNILERKVFTDGNGLLDIDTTQKRVKIAIACVEKIDLDGDVFDKKAFNRSILANGPKGADEVWHLLDHTYNVREGALSKAAELYMEGQYLVMVSPYRNTFNWREIAWPLYEAKDLKQHSVGYIKNKGEKKKDYNLITDASVFEGSAVLKGAQGDTPTLEVVKNFIDGMTKENNIDNIGKRFAKIYKGIKEEKYEDLSLLNLEFKYLEKFILENTKGNAVSADEKAKLEASAELEKKSQAIYEQLIQFNQALKNI